MSFAVEEELWFGERTDADSEKLAAQSMAARAGRILGAKPFPLAARKLSELTRDPDVPLTDLVNVLESDSALSARLLRLVNSAGYALRVRCTSVRHAAALVGIEKLHQVSTTAAILDLFDSQAGHAARILEHGTIVAALSRYLAAHLSLPTDDLFTAGFLHDIGKLMLLETEGDRYAELLEEHGESFDSLHRAERERFGFDHAVLGAHVLAAWNIPQPIPRLVAWHHQLGRAYEAGTRWCSLICALRLADQLSYCLDAEDTTEAIEQVATGEAAKFLEISEPQLDAMWHELRVLMLRSRAVFRGEEPPALEPLPSHRSGPSRKATSETPDAQEPRVPKSFPCVVCEEPSFGNRCQACGGHVCPDHELAPDSWCNLCVKDWHGHVERSRPKIWHQLSFVGGSVAVAVLAGYGASLDQTTSGVGVGLGAGLAMALACTVALVSGRWWRRTSFLRQRPNREQPEAQRVTPDVEPAAQESPELRSALEAALPEVAVPLPDVETVGPTISWAPAAEERFSTPAPRISFAPVSNDVLWGGAEDQDTSAPKLEESAAADSELPPVSNITLSYPREARSSSSFPPLELPEAPALPTSSLSFGEPERLSVSPQQRKLHEHCIPASLDAACFPEVLTNCRESCPACSALPEHQRQTTSAVPSGEGEELLASERPHELRFAC